MNDAWTRIQKEKDVFVAQMKKQAGMLEKELKQTSLELTNKS